MNMKANFLLTLLLMLVLQGFSQSLSLSFHNGPIPNGDTVLINGDVNSYMESRAFVANNGTHDIYVKVKKTEIYIVHATENTFCWGLCYPASTFISLDSIKINVGESDTINFMGDYNPAGNYGMSKIMYTFFDCQHPTDSVAMVVFYNAGYIGIEDLSANPVMSKVYPNPADELAFVNYYFPLSTAQGSVLITNVTGQRVQEYSLNSNNGRLILDVSNLNPAIYFCNLLIEGKIVKSEKFLVR